MIKEDRNNPGYGYYMTNEEAQVLYGLLELYTQIYGIIDNQIFSTILDNYKFELLNLPTRPLPEFELSPGKSILNINSNPEQDVVVHEDPDMPVVRQVVSDAGGYGIHNTPNPVNPSYFRIPRQLEPVLAENYQMLSHLPAGAYNPGGVYNPVPRYFRNSIGGGIRGTENPANRNSFNDIEGVSVRLIQDAVDQIRANDPMESLRSRIEQYTAPRSQEDSQQYSDAMRLIYEYHAPDNIAYSPPDSSPSEAIQPSINSE